MEALEDLKRLEQLYAAGYHDSFVDNALRKIIDQQIARNEATLQRLNETLKEFERQYGMPSDTFWAQYHAGQMADSADFVEWNALIKMRMRLLERLSILQGDEHAGTR